MSEAIQENLPGMDLPEPEVVKVATEKEPWYKRFFRWLFRGVKKLFQLVISGANEQITYVLNDPGNQALAVKAIEAAATKGLKGREAFDAALEVLKNGKINTSATSFIEAGKVPTNVLQTLVQLVYTCVKTKLGK